MLLACISDVELGYGSPQIAALVRHLAGRYGAEAVVIEPRDSGSGRPPVDVGIRTVPVTVDGPYTPGGRQKYNAGAAAHVEKLKPDVLVVCTTYSLPSLFLLESRPRTVLYYYLEVATVYGSSDVQMNARLDGMVDAVIFTEENRAVHFGQEFGFGGARFCVIYNCVNGPAASEPLPERNGRYLYQGTVRADTMADCFFDPAMQRVPLDIYGKLDGGYRYKAGGLAGDVKYLGYVESAELERMRPAYAYSLVLWRPDNENTRWASPNKLFESIASGVPPISTPNPQCEMLLRRHGCGMLLGGYDLDSLLEGVELAGERYDGSAYGRMVDNCARAVRAELNWPAQMAKVDRMLDKL